MTPTQMMTPDPGSPGEVAGQDQRSSLPSDSGRTTPYSTKVPSYCHSNTMSRSSVGKISIGSNDTLVEVRNLQDCNPDLQDRNCMLEDRNRILEAAAQKMLDEPTDNAPQSESVLGNHPWHAAPSIVSEHPEPSSVPGSRDGTIATPDEAGSSRGYGRPVTVHDAAPPNHESREGPGNHQAASLANSRTSLVGNPGDHDHDSATDTSTGSMTSTTSRTTAKWTWRRKTKIPLLVLGFIFMIVSVVVGSLFGAAYLLPDMLEQETFLNISSTAFTVHALIDTLIRATRTKSKRHLVLYIATIISYFAVMVAGWVLWHQKSKFAPFLFFCPVIVACGAATVRWCLHGIHVCSRLGDVEMQAQGPGDFGLNDVDDA